MTMTMTMRAGRSLLLLALLAGCSTLPAQRTFILAPPATTSPGVRNDIGRPVIEVKPVLVPDYLDTTDIVLRTGSNELRSSETGYWGERLSVGITQALAGELARRLPSALVTSHTPVMRPSLQVLVNVTVLEVRISGDAMLSANWTILRGGAAQPVARAQGSFTGRSDAGGDVGVVAAITDTIEQLGAQIATQIPPTQTPSGRR